MQSLPSAFACAARGIARAFAERNMRIHAAAAVVAVALNAALRVSMPEWLAVLLCIGAVMALECVNTAIEAVVDLASPEYHELAGRAKDCAAGAVLIMAGVSVVVACVVWGPRLLAFAFPA